MFRTEEHNWYCATEYCIDLLDKAGERWAGPIAILRNWTYCMFYVMAELWGSVVVSVLFWGFANTITTVDEAEQFYPFFGLGANVALIASGQTVRQASQLFYSPHATGSGTSYSHGMRDCPRAPPSVSSVHYATTASTSGDEVLYGGAGFCLMCARSCLPMSMDGGTRYDG
jgi:hypothetical protein